MRRFSRRTVVFARFCETYSWEKPHVMIEALFQPIVLGALRLPHRIIMPALTRMRADAWGVPGPLASKYYAQRATAALIITEATAISALAHGYPAMPGIYSPAQIAAWRSVTDAVHENGGRIALQIVHHGRWSHSSRIFVARRVSQ